MRLRNKENNSINHDRFTTTSTQGG